MTGEGDRKRPSPKREERRDSDEFSEPGVEKRDPWPRKPVMPRPPEPKPDPQKPG